MLGEARVQKRILMAKTGLDGHWRGPTIVARALRDAGFEVIMIGMANTQDIVAAAVDEDVDLVGLNIGGHIDVAIWTYAYDITTSMWPYGYGNICDRVIWM